MSLEDSVDNLSDELRAKAKACKTTEELLQLARDEGIELSDDQLEAIAGGGGWFHCTDRHDNCPKDYGEPGS